MKVVNGAVEFDHIIDPFTDEFFEACDDLSAWTVSSAEWEVDKGLCQMQSPTGGTSEDMTTISNYDLSSYDNAYLQFDYDHVALDDANDVFTVYVNSSDTGWQVVWTINGGDGGANDPGSQNIDVLPLLASSQTEVHIMARCNVNARNDECQWDNINLSGYTAPVDTAGPEIIIVSPVVNTAYPGSSINFNITATDISGVSYCWYSLTAGVTNYTMANTGDTWAATNSSIAEGAYTANFYCNDTLNFLNNSESVSFSMDNTSPGITFGAGTPDAGSSQDNTDIFVNLSTSDPNPHYAFTDFNDDLHLWLRMDDINATHVYDNSSYGNDGTIIGDAAQSAGKFGKGFEFDGVEEANPDMINITGLPGNSPVFSDSFSVSAWVKADVADTLHIVGSTSQSGTDGWSLRTAGGGDVFRFEGQGINSTGQSNYGLTESGESIQPEVWIMVTGVYDSSAPNLKLYINGSLKSTSITNLTDAGYANNLDLGVGYADVSGNVMDGKIDEVLIFNRNLSATEIAALYNASATQYTNDFTGLGEATHSFTGYAIDSAGNVDFVTRSVTIPSVGGDSCDPGAGNWVINCADGCFWDTGITVQDNISMIGTGTVTLGANMNFANNAWTISKSDGCNFVINSAGSIT